MSHGFTGQRSLPAAKFELGDANGIPTPVSLSGQATMDAAGALALAANLLLTGTPTAATAAVDTTTTQVATTAFVVGQAASVASPSNADAAVVGTSTRYARQDHIHPFAVGQQVGAASASYTANSNLTATIPLDDTIPQNTEGTEILSASITPKNVNNTIVVEFSGFGTVGTNNRTIISALFRDSVADALNAAAVETKGLDTATNLVLRHSFVAGTVSPITLKIRVGPNAAATVRLNGTSAARQFGGIAAATLIVREIDA